MELNISDFDKNNIIKQYHSELIDPFIINEETTTSFDFTIQPKIGSTKNLGKTTFIQKIPKNSKLVKSTITDPNTKKTYNVVNISVPKGLTSWTYYCGTKPTTFILNSSLLMYNGAEYSDYPYTLSTWIEQNMCNKKEEVKIDTGTEKENTTTKTANEIKTEQCALDCNSRYPYYSVVCDGGNWTETLNSWIKEKGGGKDETTYKSLRTSWCSGWRPGQTPENLIDFITPVFLDSTNTTIQLQQNNQRATY